LGAEEAKGHNPSAERCGDEDQAVTDRTCTCPPDERPRYCVGKYALTDCLRSELEAAQYAADYFAASFFAEQARLIEAEKRAEVAEEHLEEARAQRDDMLVWKERAEKAESSARQFEKQYRDIQDYLVRISSSHPTLPEGMKEVPIPVDPVI
jgi:predicted  nucleic acid-binding Zn-ribbon protein